MTHFARPMLIGLDAIEAEVRDGGAREALEYSIRSNARHGLRFSNADKRRVVGLMLDDAEWSLLSDREIGRRCGVSQPFVGKVRAERGDNGYQPLDDECQALYDESHRLLSECEATIAPGMGNLRPMLETLRTARRLVGPERYTAWFAKEGFGDKEAIKIALRFYPEFADVIPS